MAKQNKTTEITSKKQRRSRVKTPPVAELTEELARLSKLPGGSVATMGDGTIKTQAGWLGNTRIQTVQRQALAIQIGQVQGNDHLQRVLTAVFDNQKTAHCQNQRQMMTALPEQDRRTKSHSVQRNEKQARPANLLVEEIWQCIPKWMKPGLLKEPARQKILLILYARIGPQLWRHVGEITYIGQTGVMDFKAKDETALIAQLKAQGYTDAYYAKRGDNRWGLREHTSKGPSLHWRGVSEGKVNVHIDLHPPKSTGFEHWFMDSFRRETTHTLAKLQAGVERLNKYIPVLSEGKKYEKLRAYFKTLEKFAQDQTDVLGAVKRGRQYLLKAIAYVMREQPLKKTDLEKIKLYLRKAHVEALRGAQLLRTPHK